MIINEIKGNININGTKYFIKSTNHSQQIRGNAPQSRDKIITFSFIKKLFKNINIPEGKFVVTWKYNDFWNGILFANKNNYITIITAIIGQKKKSPDKIFSDVSIRFNQENIND